MLAPRTNNCETKEDLERASGNYEEAKERLLQLVAAVSAGNRELKRVIVKVRQRRGLPKRRKKRRRAKMPRPKRSEA